MSTISKEPTVEPIRNRSDFCRIQRVPYKQTEKCYRLNNIFRAIIESVPVTIGAYDMFTILQHDLKIPEINLRQPLLNVLEETVLHYCKEWSGWDKPITDYQTEVQIMVGIKNLREFLSAKCNFVITHAQQYILEIAKSVCKGNEESSLTEQVCPYKLVISGWPIMLNTTAVQIKGENILIKQHSQQKWTPLTLSEFLNWPHVSVEVKLLDLHIKRENSHKFERYITKPIQKTVQTEDEFITNVTRHSNQGKPYTHTFFSFYFIQLFNVLQKLNNVNPARFKELQTVYTQFLDDVKDMNIAHGSMCTDTTVSFHIGKQHYIRSKQIFVPQSQENTSGIDAVSFVEHIKPQVDLTLFYCIAVQDMEDAKSVTFKRLNTVSKRSETDHEDIENLTFIINNTCIEYGCTFCYKKFNGNRALKSAITHFAQFHKVGHPVICYKCHVQFQVKDLAGIRWKHECL